MQELCFKSIYRTHEHSKYVYLRLNKSSGSLSVNAAMMNATTGPMAYILDVTPTE